MVKLEKVEKYFNRYKSNQIHAINSTTLKFENTGLVAILGNSGSGKSIEDGKNTGSRSLRSNQDPGNLIGMKIRGGIPCAERKSFVPWVLQQMM